MVKSLKLSEPISSPLTTGLLPTVGRAKWPLSSLRRACLEHCSGRISCFCCSSHCSCSADSVAQDPLGPVPSHTSVPLPTHCCAPGPVQGTHRRPFWPFPSLLAPSFAPLLCSPASLATTRLRARCPMMHSLAPQPTLGKKCSETWADMKHP